MFNKPKNWIAGGLWRPKNLHSLEHLKFLYNVLCKNQLVTENNKSLLVETLRSISEILIWGDQNDSSVFDFFLEKNMLSFFLRFMRQKSGRYICVQLLQTLNILFDNISNETSVYYLLSNNHINSIIVHKFDFSDEEVMAYYISFLKTLSLKLNKHTIHFFYNEHTNDFALYTEAIKFFNHPESMVRIAVRTITLNVYKVDDKSMLRYIRDKTAAPYFSNLVWFIGNHIIELDSCVRNDADHHSRDRLADLVAEHLDHLHYLNDILCLHIDALNEVLTDHLLNRLLVPLYVYSLTKRRKYSARTGERPHVSSVVSLFLLSQVFLILSHAPLVRQLADIIFNGDISVCMVEKDQEGSPQAGGARTERKFVKPTEPLAQLLDNNRGKGGRPMKRPNYRNTDEPDASTSTAQTETSGDDVLSSPSTAEGAASPGSAADLSSPNQNSTDEEKLAISGTLEQRQAEFSLANRPYLEAVFNALQCSENDYEALFALCLLYAMGHNDGINQELLDSVLMPTDKSTSKDHYNILLVEKLIMVIGLSCKNGSKVRLATLEMSILLLKQLVYSSETCFLSDLHLACLEGAREESTLLLRNFYKSEEIFLDMFEDEFREMKTRPLNVEYLTMDASILLPPTGTPLTGIDFNKRLPCGEVERARRAIRVFFLLRDLSLTLRQETETQLPLTKQDETVRVSEVLDLNNSDLIACTVITKDHRRERRFLVIDVLQLILVEPDTRRLGWGVVKFVGFLQDVEVSGDKDDSRSLHITIHKPSMNVHARPLPLLSARFIFDDHIRCMAAKQRLTKGRLKARQRKMQMIARLLELPTHLVDSMYQPSTSGFSAASNAMKNSSPGAAMAVRSHQVPGRALPDQTGRTRSDVVQRSVFASIEKTSGFGNAREREVHSKIPTPGGAARRVSQPIPIKPQPNGAPAGQPVQAVPHEGSPEIEEAEEAQPSPQAHAFQSLNLSSQQQEQRTRHHSGRSALENLPHLQEIPLEDLSKKAKAALSSATDFLTARRSLSAETRGRSSSYSPRRGRSSSTGSSSPLGRGSPHSGSPTSRARSDSRTGRQRAGSYPLAKQTKSVPAVSKQSTSFMINKQGSDHSGYAYEDPNAKRIEQQSVSGNRSRSNSGAGPKTLTPAQEPALSLVPSSGNNATLSNSAPKLLPPAEPEVLRKRSDTSSGDSESGASDSGSVTSASTEDSKDAVFKSKPQFTYDMPAPPTVDVNQAVAGRDGVELSTAADDSATDQLTKLAQMVQEHYSTLEEGANTIKLTSTAEIDDCRNQSS